jgi:hypothetical protein
MNDKNEHEQLRQLFEKQERGELPRFYPAGRTGPYDEGAGLGKVTIDKKHKRLWLYMGRKKLGEIGFTPASLAAFIHTLQKGYRMLTEEDGDDLRAEEVEEADGQPEGPDAGR